MANFPTISKDFDASSFEETSENVAVTGGNSEGGYQWTRPRSTRRPRRIYEFEFKDISDAEKSTLQTFWDDHFGGSLAFNWVHPISGVTINVRFDDGMKMQFKRSGYGTNHRWDTGKITLKEV